ncbi:MAG: DUF177 domain-containing protein [Acidobacteria bacterium]|nr:MAG: DUF177 domain-containing protein [Acidobacteriota bacterium]
MFIETKEIGPEGLIVSRSIDAFRLPVSDQDSIRVDRVQLSGELQRDQDGFSFAGRIETALTLSCSRCLEEYSSPLDLPFDLFYTTSREGGARQDSRIDEEMATVTHFDGARIDLMALVSEQIYLGLPLKPLCRPDCPGLCPRCGTNLNAGSCACAEKRTEDPRLRVLKNLL